MDITETDKQMSVGELGLSSSVRNRFEILEKNGPPIRIPHSTENTNTNNNEGDDDVPALEPSTDMAASSSCFNRRKAVQVTGDATTSNSEPPSGTRPFYGPLLNPSASTSCAPTYPTLSCLFNNNNNNDSSPTIDDNNNNNGNKNSSNYVGLINQAMTCYLNSLLQTLFMTPEFRNGIYRWKYVESSSSSSSSSSATSSPSKEVPPSSSGGETTTTTTTSSEDNNNERARSIPFQLQRLFLNLQTSPKRSIQTSDLTRSFGWTSDDAFQQHDVQELCRVMFDALEKNFKNTEQANLINELYQGKIKDYVKCLECNKENARVSVFLDISLCIRPFGSDKTYESVEAALDAYIQPETLDEANAYYCDRCERMCRAHKGLKFESFPYIISLQLNRFDFDYTTMSRFKISNRVSFPETLNVKKYLSSEGRRHRRRSQLLSTTSLDANNQVEQHVDAKMDTDDAADGDDDDVEENVDDSIYDYELFSIMIHSGSATGGHYYAYIKCFETGQWHTFNDERVMRLDKSEIYKTYGTTGASYSSSTAYMLFYRQIGRERNEPFMRVEQFDAYLRDLLHNERSQQIEAERRKEYMENSCKIKCIVPWATLASLSPAPTSTDNTTSSSSSSGSGNKMTTFKEKTISVHKDLTLEQAKCEVIRELELGALLDKAASSSPPLKCRLLKYDSYNELIEASYANESTLSVYEALGFTKTPYGMCWYVEMVAQDEPHTAYSPDDINVKVMRVDSREFRSDELFHMRLANDATLLDLRTQLASRLNATLIIEHQRIRMAMERPPHNCVYLADRGEAALAERLRALHFARVNKLFIEYDDHPSSATTGTIALYMYLDGKSNSYSNVGQFMPSF